VALATAAGQSPEQSTLPGLCGWFGALRSDSAEVLLAQMSAGLGAATTRLYSPQAACAVSRGGHGAKAQPELIAAIVGFPYWSTAHLARHAADQGHAAALVAAYQQYGADFLLYLHGAFTAAILDSTAERLLVAIDRLGQMRLCYAVTAEALIFGSTADSVLAHPQVDGRLSAQALFDYVYFHMTPSPHCIYAAQRKLPGGHLLDYRAGRLQVKCYWQPQFTEPPAPVEALGEEMQGLIRQAVKRLSQDAETGAFLSGGLDSSTVAGMLAQVKADPVSTFSIGFAVEDYDEMRYARLAAEHFQTRQHEYYVTPEDVAGIVPTIAGCYDEPFGNSSVVPAYYCARLAAQAGVRRLLGGDGGDELFAGNSRYVKQQVFEHYQRLPVLLRRSLLEPLLYRLPAQPALLRKARSYIEQAKIPLPDRLQTYNFLHRHSSQEIFAEDFLAAIDPEQPLHWQRELYHRPTDASVLNRMLYLDWQHTLADDDLRKVGRMCALAGVEVAYPLLDDEIVALACRTPSRLKCKGQSLRYFYKQAMRDFLPPEIITKSKHGFGLPFGIWTRSYQPLQELAYDSLLRLKRSPYFRPAFIDQAIDLHRRGHAAYYGELIWVLMMLCLWLEQHGHAW